MTNPEPLSVQLPMEPTILITDGAKLVSMFSDGYRGEPLPDLTPMRKASVVARLRVLADLLELSA